MWTGLMPHQAGVDRNTIKIPEAFRSRELGILLSQAGYDCGYAGKWHLANYTISDEHGFEKLERAYDPDVTKACVKYLKRDRKKPFFLVASYNNPHDICGWAYHRNFSRCKNGHIEDGPPEKWPDLPKNYGIPLREPPIVQQYHAGGGQFPTEGWTRQDWQHYRYAYYRMVERVDWEIGQVLDTLRSKGLEDNTVIIFSSDHGDGLGAHGWNQKWVFYDECSRVPFIVSHKNRTTKRFDDKHLVSQGLDLYATILDYAGVKQLYPTAGRSLRPLAEGRAPEKWRDHVVSEMWMNYPTPLGRMVRTDRYKYTAWSEGKTREMLVDLHEDPGEMFNLVGSEKLKGVLNHHRGLLAEHCKNINDPFTSYLPEQS